MFSIYVDSLERLAFRGIPRRQLSRYPELIDAALNGGPSVELAKSDPLHRRRSAGAFFTHRAIAQKMISSWQPSDHTFTYIDPSCGAGDLLLTVARQLPVRDTLDATLELWSDLLVGYDVDPRFVSATKSRLVLLARHRIRDAWHVSLSTSLHLFPNIVVADGLTQLPPPDRKHIRLLMNPPFTKTQAPIACSWATGQVSSAAVFLHYWVSCLPPASDVVALLPDALRSGSRYDRWRQAIETRTQILDIAPLMKFSPTTDIHVFLLTAKINAQQDSQCSWWPQPPASSRVRDFFDVRVGAVVPHRHPHVGPILTYATTHDLPVGDDVNTIHNQRQFAGTAFKGPFLTVRRTSRPGGTRCAVTLVSSTDLIAVENHLIVLLPKDGTVAICRNAMREIAAPAADRWLDERIRCRHLTVSAVESIPLTQETK